MSKGSKILVTKITIWNFFHRFLPSHRAQLFSKPAFTAQLLGEKRPGAWARVVSPCLSACSVAWPCLTLCDPKDCSPPGSSVRGVFQARMLEWVAISSSKGSSRSRDRTHISCVKIPAVAGRFLTTAPPGKPTVPVGRFEKRADLWDSLEADSLKLKRLDVGTEKKMQ